MKRFESQRGQMLLIVVLTMIVALTVGLSVVSRTITNLRISRQSEESQRAFQAAEAGIEQALESGNAISNLNFTNNSSYTTTLTEQSGTSFLMNAGEVVDQDSGIDLWLSEYPSYANPRSGTITLFWNTSSQTSCDSSAQDAIQSAVELFMLSGSIASPTVSKFVYDSCGRITGALSPGAGGTVGNITFAHGTTIPVTNGLIMRIIPVYNSTKVGITSTVNLPSQGSVVESVGESGDTVRKVQYFTSHPQVPLEIFPYSIISQ